MAATGTATARIDGPNVGELDRAEWLMGKLSRAAAVARKCNALVRLDLEDAEELVQLLADSIRTAKQIRDGIK